MPKKVGNKKLVCGSKELLTGPRGAASAGASAYTHFGRIFAAPRPNRRMQGVQGRGNRRSRGTHCAQVSASTSEGGQTRAEGYRLAFPSNVALTTTACHAGDLQHYLDRRHPTAISDELLSGCGTSRAFSAGVGEYALPPLGLVFRPKATTESGGAGGHFQRAGLAR